MVSGFPEIKTRLLEKYFANRFNLRKDVTQLSYLRLSKMHARLSPKGFYHIGPNFHGMKEDPQKA